jgi:hypothetical protein
MIYAARRLAMNVRVYPVVRYFEEKKQKSRYRPVSQTLALCLADSTSCAAMWASDRHLSTANINRLCDGNVSPSVRNAVLERRTGGKGFT